MKNMNFTPNFWAQEAITSTNRAAGVADVAGISVDCQNAECVVALIEFGIIVNAATTSLTWQGSDDNSTWHDIEDATMSVGGSDDNDYFVFELSKPENRYNRVVVYKDGTNNVTLRSAQYLVGGPRYTRGANDDGSFAYSNYEDKYHVGIHIGGDNDDTHANPKAP